MDIRLARTVALLCALLVGAAPAAAGDAGGATFVSLHADNTPVIEILDLLAARSGLNIVAGEAVQGRKITLHLKDTPFEEALALVSRASGLGYERIGNSILVADPARLGAPTGLVSRVFELSYADAEQVREVLEALSTDIRADVRGNRLVLHATQAAVEDAGRIIAQLDVKPQQVLLEARLIEVNTSKLLEVGIDWSKITKWSTLVTEGDYGQSPAGQLPDNVDFVPIGEGDKLFRQTASWDFSIEALLTDGNARLLANSKVVTLDGEAAEIFAGQTVPVVITSLQDPGSGGVLQTVQLEKIDVGVRLNITPRIGEDGLITTLVEPEVSRIIDFVGPDNDLPQTSTRRARTLVRVKDGQKIYMGGLLSEETRKAVKKVPLLGDIPLLGALFRHTRDETQSLDLVIEITPRIVGDEGALVPSGQLLHPDMDVEDRDTLIGRQFQPAAGGPGDGSAQADPGQY